MDNTQPIKTKEILVRKLVICPTPEPTFRWERVSVEITWPAGFDPKREYGYTEMGDWVVTTEAIGE